QTCALPIFIGPSHQIESDRHTVMHGEVFIDIIVPPIVTEAFRLRMSHNSHLCADHFKVFKMEIGTTDVKDNYPTIGRLHGRHIEYGALSIVAKIMYALVLARPAFTHIAYMCPYPTPARRHNLFGLNFVRSSSEVYLISRLHQ